MAIIALVVYEKVGLAILRTAWINLDRTCAGALILTGAVTLLLWSTLWKRSHILTIEAACPLPCPRTLAPH